MKAWHFTNEKMTLGYGDGRKIVEGECLSCEGDIEICRNGMHGSKRIVDALRYAPGPILTRVEITGDVVEDDNKIAGRHRKVLWSLDATEILHRFAVQVALDACHEAGVTDPVVLAAPQAKLDWLDGKISNEELVAARSAAWSAAWSDGLACSAASACLAACSAARWAGESVAKAAQEKLLQKMVSKTEWA